MDIISRNEIQFWLLDDFWPDCVALNIIVYSLEAEPLIPWGGGGVRFFFLTKLDFFPSNKKHNFFFLPDQKQTIFFLR